ncbi:MAG TPA: CSLREA domain-containing protein, partial [Solirubrobacteraceae bacterium]|nr:CSLREA domain-containing protein [Solirubrobacteraceae bacterium]
MGLCVAALCAPASASATVYTVNTTDDHFDQQCTPADCTLREALGQAGGLDEVHVPPGTYALVQSLGQLNLARDTIVGA